MKRPSPAPTQIPLAEAIRRIRDEIREGILESEDKSIVFVPQDIQLELAIALTAEASASGGLRAFVIVDPQPKSRAAPEIHTVRITFSIANASGSPMKVSIEPPEPFRVR
jgi:hypothetical protein